MIRLIRALVWRFVTRGLSREERARRADRERHGYH